MSVAILRSDARSLPLPDSCADLIVTSPPYWALRSYSDNGEHYDGQIGSEETPGEWLASLVECTREWARVLKPSGSIFVNLGDKYANDAKWGGRSNAKQADSDQGSPGYRQRVVTGVAPKSLIGLPWRYALACMDELGLTLRRDIVWHKVNPLPESVDDRCATRHEYLFHFVRQPRYYAAVDEIREPNAGITGGQDRRAFESGNGIAHRSGNKDYSQFNLLGKLPGSVWDIPSQPLVVPPHVAVDHYAAFPFELPRRCILGWSPRAVCLDCGEGRRPISTTALIEDRKGRRQRIVDLALDGAHGPDGRGGERWRRSVAISGYACACTPYTDHPATPPPSRPALVVDPFGGTGTTALMADVLGRDGISFDRSGDYCRLARWRTADPGERARAMQVPKPPVIPDGQDALFTLGEAAS